MLSVTSGYTHLMVAAVVYTAILETVFLIQCFLSGNLFKSYEEVGIMDKQHDHILSNHTNDDHYSHSSKRPRWLTLCMMATAASVIVLAGCGDNEEVAPPAEEAAPLEQDTTAEPATGMNDEPAAMEQDPGLSEDPAEQGSMTQPESGMPEDTMDEPAEGVMDPDEEAGFGEGTDPMPGVEDDDDEMSTQ